VAGDNQTARTDAEVPILPSVCARDAFGNPLPDFAVTFAVMSGGGSLTEGDAVTGTDGEASVGSWVLGPEPGENTLAASGTGLNGSPQTFVATAALAVPVATSLGCVALILMICFVVRRKAGKKASL
jgi:hypothetical protein